MHTEKHPLAGATVILNEDTRPGAEVKPGEEYRIEDWWDHLTGGSWMYAEGNPACLKYAMRSGMAQPPLPMDNEVVYGKIGAFGHLIHVSELGEVVPGK